MKLIVKFDDGRVMDFSVANENATSVYQIITNHFSVNGLNGKSISELLTEKK
jgi:hypothetical protein